MKLLILNGSPRAEKSNSLRLANAFAGGVCSETGGSVETLHLSRMEIHPCRGCFGCWRATPGKCVIRDDMADVLEKILRADIVIWSFPLYYFSLPAQTKAVLDRMLPMNLPFMKKAEEDKSGSGGHPSRYDLSGQKRVLVSTCGFYTAEGNYTAVTAQFDRLWGKDGYETVFCGQGELFHVPQMAERTDVYLSAVYQAGQEFASGKIRPETRAQLSKLLLPRETFEKLADQAW